MSQIANRSYLMYFFIFYIFYYACAALHGTFIPLYLDSIKLNNTAIGLLLAIGSVVSFISQPFWGLASDRNNSKNKILNILIFFSAISFLLFQFSINIFYIAVVMLCFAFFERPIAPIYDSITLQYLEKEKKNFGQIRLGGTIGYALIALLVGGLLKQNIKMLFIIYFVIAMTGFFITLFLPKVEGHQSNKNKVSIMTLFKDPKLIILLFFNLIIQSTIGFYNSFFTIYYKHMGADEFLIGWAVLLATVAEIPFLLTGEKLINKIGVKNTLFGSAFIAIARWLLLFFIEDPYIILALQLIHGFIFIVFVFSLVIYISKEVPKELQSTGQAISALVTTGIAPIIGSILGGLLSDRSGIRNVFLYNAIIITVTVCIVSVIFFSLEKKEITQPNPEHSKS